jgi:hypothetical protein
MTTVAAGILRHAASATLPTLSASLSREIEAFGYQEAEA